MIRLLSFVIIGLVSVGCGLGEDNGPAPGPAKGKSDTGWISNSSYELGAVLASKIVHSATGSWGELATDRALQEQLIDT